MFLCLKKMNKTSINVQEFCIFAQKFDVYGMMKISSIFII